MMSKSREIKFRVWDKEARKMLDHTDILVCNQGTLLGDLWIDDAPDYELMQYTGLKDKNGVEVFEGDIVKVWHYNAAVGKRETPEVYTVEYARNAAFLLHNNGVWPWVGFDETGRSEYEVIGNAWENPELLQEAA